jgi:hypothetical protein
MGDILQHAESSAKKFGGVPKDYFKIHEVLDCSKLFLADWRHRSVLHNTFGVYLLERWIIGPTFIRESDGVECCTRTVATQHIMEDLNMVPTLGEFLREMPLRRWMMRATPKEVERMKGVTFGDETQDPALSERVDTPIQERVTATVVWHSGNVPPPENGWYLVDQNCAQKHEARGCPALYYLAGSWYIDTRDMMIQGGPMWWAKIPVDPTLDLEQ